jgi:hypothetical protein
MRHCNHVDLPRLNLVDDAVGKSLQHGKTMIGIVAREQLRTGLNQSQEVFYFKCSTSASNRDAACGLRA